MMKLGNESKFCDSEITFACQSMTSYGNQIKFIVRQIHIKKKKTQSSIKKVNPNMEYWLGNTEELGKFESQGAS